MPFGEKATPSTAPLRPVKKSRNILPVATSQSFTVASQLADATFFPFGEKATSLTIAVCPVNVRSSLPVDTSQSFNVLSELPEISVFPSGEKEME